MENSWCNKKVLITGSAGLIGSESAKFFGALGFEIHGIDNDMRRYFFGKEASTQWSLRNLKEKLKDKYRHYDIDIRDNKKIKYHIEKQEVNELLEIVKNETEKKSKEIN